MGRKSFNSKQNFLAASALKPNAKTRGRTLPDQIMETKLRSEQAKLKMLEAELPDENAVKYMRYEDMPPPTPEQEAEFDAEFQRILNELFDEDEDGEESDHEKGRGEEGPDAGQTVQAWLRARGAIIPDLPEWKTPLYLERWIDA